jgi:hypothetical protein
VILIVYLLDFGGEVFYVGSTGRYPERIGEHLALMREGRHPSKRVQAAYALFGVPVASVLETLRVSTPQEAADTESKHILKYREVHRYHLCNVGLADPRSFECWFPIPDEDLQWSAKGPQSLPAVPQPRE